MGDSDMKSDGGQVYPKRIRAINPDWSSECEMAAGLKDHRSIKAKMAGIKKYNNIDAPGMSVRTLAAIEIMAARCGNPHPSGTDDEERARRAVKAADLLIAELEKPCES